jgi:hypothetical protein
MILCDGLQGTTNACVKKDSFGLLNSTPFRKTSKIIHSILHLIGLDWIGFDVIMMLVF